MQITENRLTRAGLRLADWSERWFPDPFVFALLGIVLVFALGLLAGQSASQLSVQAGKGFWSLIPFTMQMAMVLIGGSVVAHAPPVLAAIRKLSTIPKTPRNAVTLIATVSLLLSLVSWGLSLVFAGMLARELGHRVKGLDYRAAGAAAYLGLGAVWALGLSSSAAMMMATQGAVPASLFTISGLIPLTHTIFSWPSLVLTGTLCLVSVLVARLSTPTESAARTASDFGVMPSEREIPVEALETDSHRPAARLDRSPWPLFFVAALLAWSLLDHFAHAETGALAALDLNTYNLTFLTLGLVLHGRPDRFVRAVSQAVPATSGILVQFPFYAAIFGMITGTGLSEWMARAFVSASTPGSFPLFVGLYSAVLGSFVPSGGSKWLIEAPYVLEAAKLHHVHLGWVVQIYNATEALPNLINPFFMLPILGILGLRARDLIGFGMLQLAVHVPIVFGLCWYFARVLEYVPPTH